MIIRLLDRSDYRINQKKDQSHFYVRFYLGSNAQILKFVVGLSWAALINDIEVPAKIY